MAFRIGRGSEVYELCPLASGVAWISVRNWHKAMKPRLDKGIELNSP